MREPLTCPICHVAHEPDYAHVGKVKEDPYEGLREVLETPATSLEIKHDDGKWRPALGVFKESYLREMWAAGRTRLVTIREVVA